MNCVYYSAPFLKFNRPPGVSTFGLKNTRNPERYLNLEQFLHCNPEAENSVIAHQYKCHRDLSLKEFIAFGSLRCGYGIQVRNLYAAISSQKLSLEKEAVFALILETIWEVGPVSDRERECCVDFLDFHFSLQFLQLLRTTLESNSSNWSSPLVILSVIVITLRILEVNDNTEVRITCSTLLQELRGVLSDWNGKLKDLFKRAEKASESERTELLELQTLANVSIVYTYDVNDLVLFEYVIADQVGVTHWLQAVTNLGHLLRREKGHLKLSPFMTNIVRHATQTIPLNILDYLQQKILEEVGNSSKSALHAFVTQQMGSLDPSSSKWIRCEPPKGHVYQGQYSSRSSTGNETKVHLDILRGTFLISGSPPEHLPETIMGNQQFQRFFLTSQFKVQRNGSKFITTEPYFGHNYEFFKDSPSGNLIIRQLHQNHFLELLPPALFKEYVSNHLIDNYTHWWHSTSNEVHFRRKPVELQDYKVQDVTEYTFVEYNGKRLLQVNNSGAGKDKETFVVSIKSEGFKQVVTNLRRLDLENIDEIVDVILELDEARIPTNILAKVRKLNLSFRLLKEGLLGSCNFPEYYVPISQNLGTLIGSACGLLLECNTTSEVTGRKKLFLIQHGEIKITKISDFQHQATAINLGKGRQPPYFVFEIDSTLRRLKASNDKCAWLYLAALHAATSSPHSDPFTGQTGVEMAMWILKSGLVWSCAPYDDCSLKILERIRSFSPIRGYYPPERKKMQFTIWPEGLEDYPYAAFDGYEIIVDELLKDSRRLEVLFSKDHPEAENEYKTPVKLRQRGYNRNLVIYNESVHLESNPGVAGYELSTDIETERSSENVHEFARIRMKNTVHKPFDFDSISELLLQKDVLSSKATDNVTTRSLPEWLELSLRPNWFRFYTLASSPDYSSVEHEFTLILGAILYSGKDLDGVLSLHNVSVWSRRGNLNLPSVPATTQDFYPLDHHFERADIEKILEGGRISFPKSGSEFKTHSAYQAAQMEYNNDTSKHIKNVASTLRGFWPREKLEESDLNFSGKNLKIGVLSGINSKFGFWFNNLALHNFVSSLERKMKTGYRNTPPDRIEVTEKVSDYISIKTRLALRATRVPGMTPEMSQAAEDLADFSFILSLTEVIFEFGTCLGKISTMSTEKQRKFCLTLIHKLETTLEAFVTHNPSIRALSRVGLFIRRSPLSLLELLRINDGKVSDPIYKIAGALAVLYSELQRLNRILKYGEKAFQQELERELISENFEGWSPLQNVEWLLLQLELNITIRPVQLRVANHMMNMTDQSGVMQLNMGEGKTSVIVPMVVATLSKPGDVLCRVTVLRSIFETNFSLLCFTLGGLLKKRVYTIPCHRDLTGIPKVLGVIRKTYEECLRLKGVVVTLPEYRLSFKLMTYNFLKDEPEIGRSFYEIETWLKDHVRDIVDESDEIFSVKYQLVYTTGCQQKIDGAQMRWEVCQKVLQILPEIATELLDKYGETVIEMKRCWENKPEQFPEIRILSDVCKQDLHDQIADAILGGKISLLGSILSSKERRLVRAFLTDEFISKEDHDSALGVYLEPENHQILLILSAYLKGGVLFASLSKRWRVDAGVNPKGRRSMAVPFRAKDVAAERTEFGHPDVAIVLTQLSYYYSGLSDKQLEQTFLILKGTLGAASVYKGWIDRIPPRNVHPSIKDYGGINLIDYEQRTEYLFPVLRRHKAVIDFWLGSQVFPQESKQFPGKIVTNAWDLCCRSYKNPVTGFSGTNDSSLLLPGNINQQDLEELKETNRKVEEILKQPENNILGRSLPPGVSSEEILQNLIDDNIQVLVDPGALMLQFGNEQVAQKWLELDKSCEAVLYFGEDNKVLVKPRSSSGKGPGSDIQLQLSSYAERLEECRVYLDDQHSRGTDLKLPTSFKACVTVGSRMRRDKLIQACMRMRKLGKGQSVHFYLSHEVHNKILEMRGGNEKVTTDDILTWVKRNSQDFEKDGLVYWAQSGKNYAQKLAADKMYSLSDKVEEDGKVFAKHCEDSEVLELSRLYGLYERREKVVDMIPRWFASVKYKLGMFPSWFWNDDSDEESEPSDLENDDSDKESEPSDLENDDSDEESEPSDLENDDSDEESEPSDLENDESEAMQIVSEIENQVLDRCLKHIPTATYATSMVDEEQEKELEPEHEERIDFERPSAESPAKPGVASGVRRFVLEGGKLSVGDGVMGLGDIFRNATFWGEIQAECWGDKVFVSEDFGKVIEFKRGHLDCFLRPLSYLVTWEGGDEVYTLLISMFEANALIQEFRSLTRSTRLHMFAGRSFVGQPTLVNNPRLQLPSSGEGIRLPEEVVGPLLIASGNLFFDNIQEQRAFAGFLGLLLRPWGKSEEEAFDKGKIAKTGFVLLEYREEILKSARITGLFFKKDPTGMVRAILKCRNELLRDGDHTVQILDRCGYITNLKGLEE